MQQDRLKKSLVTGVTRHDFKPTVVNMINDLNDKTISVKNWKLEHNQMDI